MDKQEYDAKVAWLRRYKESQRREKILCLELEQLRSRAERVTRALTGMPAAQTQQNDRIPSCIEHMMECEGKLHEEIARGQNIRSEIEAAIAELEDIRARELLALRYLYGRTFEQTAECMDLSVRWAYVLHRRALRGIKL